MKKVAAAFPGMLMVVTAIACCVILYSRGENILLAAVIGAAFGVISVWGVFFLGYRIWMFATRGAPFRVGDRLRVTSGKHQGQVGRVTQVVEGDALVMIRLEGAPDENGECLLPWSFLKRFT